MVSLYEEVDDSNTYKLNMTPRKMMEETVPPAGFYLSDLKFLVTVSKE